MVIREAAEVDSISWDAVYLGCMRGAVYAAIKAAIIACLQTLARQHARDAICFHGVYPGPTQTRLV